jgi:hypothetical protein
MSTSTDEAAPPWAQWLAKNNPALTRGFLLVAAACTAIPVGVAIAYRGQSDSFVLAWGICLALIFFGAGILSFAYYPEKVSSTERVRLLLMASLGLAGLFTALLGFVLPFTTYWGILGEMASWGEKRRELFWIVSATIGGLALMFVSLTLVSGMERGNQFVRWLVYGFNAVLSTLLLAIVLAVLNALVYFDTLDQAFGRVFSRGFDFTRTSMYTLNTKTEAFLDKMDERVKAYVIIDQPKEREEDLETLLRNFEGRSNGKFRWELLLGIAPRGRARIMELKKKYGVSEEGILLVSGDEDGKHDTEFVPWRRLVREKFDPTGRSREPEEVFTGENALLVGLTSLLEGQVTIYFAQGHGEMSLDPHGMPGRPVGPPSESISTMKRRLEGTRSKLSVKPLNMGTGGVKAVPDDAAALVIARPTQRWGEDELKVLNEYLTRKETRSGGKVTVTAGRLVALLPPIVTRTGDRTELLKTGLEKFLGPYGVRVTDNRVQALREDVLAPLCQTSRSSPSPVGRAFDNESGTTLFRFRNVREVGAARGGRFSASPLVLARPPAWLEDNFSRDPEAFRARLLRDPALIESIRDKLLIFPRAASVAVAVSEAPMPGGGEQGRPVMVVFGASDWVSDAGLRGAEGNNNADLFVSCLSWVREQPDIGELVPPKEFGEYKLTIEADVSLWRLVFMPLFTMVLGVIALGVGVWVVRRS